MTPSLDKSLRFFRDVIGLDEVERRDGVVYLRAWGEFEHHSLSLREGPANVDHIAWRARSAEDVDRFAERLGLGGTELQRVEAGEEVGQGEAIRFTTPAGHPFEIYYEVDKPLAPPEIRARLKSNNASAWRRGASPRRIDHVTMAGKDVPGGYEWLRDNLGLKLREFLRPTGRPMAGVWLSVTSQVHDMALIRDLEKRNGRLHHFAYTFDTPTDVMRGADILREHDVSIDLGPGMHGLTRGFYCYVKDPGSGHRLELFCGGYHIFDPDWEPLEWTEKEYVEAFSWWGPTYTTGHGHPMDATSPCGVEAPDAVPAGSGG